MKQLFLLNAMHLSIAPTVHMFYSILHSRLHGVYRLNIIGIWFRVNATVQGITQSNSPGELLLLFVLRYWPDYSI